MKPRRAPAHTGPALPVEDVEPLSPQGVDFEAETVGEPMPAHIAAHFRPHHPGHPEHALDQDTARHLAFPVGQVWPEAHFSPHETLAHTDAPDEIHGLMTFHEGDTKPFDHSPSRDGRHGREHWVAQKPAQEWEPRSIALPAPVSGINQSVPIAGLTPFRHSLTIVNIDTTATAYLTRGNVNQTSLAFALAAGAAMTFRHTREVWGFTTAAGGCALTISHAFDLDPLEEERAAPHHAPAAPHGHHHGAP